MTRQLVALYPGIEALDPKLRTTLAELLPINFICGRTHQNRSNANAEIWVGAEWSSTSASNHSSRPLLFIQTDGAIISGGTAGPAIQYSTSATIDQRIRGRLLHHRSTSELRAIAPEPGDEILASVEQKPIWINRISNGARTQIVAGPLPTFTADGVVGDQLNPHDFHPLLPILHFLREFIGEKGWRAPKLRACLMFDDPNLHWPTYGYVDYEQLIRRAEAENFHVTFATVPIDSWMVNAKTARLFREHSKRVSLLIHGNDHLREELGRITQSDQHLKIFAQGLRRIAGLETKGQIAVSRVMAPPHGACSENLMSSMLRVGIAGATISSGSLRGWNKGKTWSPAFGVTPAEIMDGGFPVIPRFRIAADCENTVVMSAFLNRPIIPVGHHDSFAGGLDLLSKVAKTINSLGEVEWCTPEAMLHSNYLWHQDAQTLWIKPYSVNFSHVVPEGIRHLRFELPETFPAETAFRVKRSRNGAVTYAETLTASDRVDVMPGESLEIASTDFSSVDPMSVPAPNRSWWALPRRILCEARDRVTPMMARKNSTQASTSALTERTPTP